MFVTVGKTDHQAWLLEELEGKETVLVRWESTREIERVHVSQIQTTMPSRRSRRQRTLFKFEEQSESTTTAPRRNTKSRRSSKKARTRKPMKSERNQNMEVKESAEVPKQASSETNGGLPQNFRSFEEVEEARRDVVKNRHDKKSEQRRRRVSKLKHSQRSYKLLVRKRKLKKDLEHGGTEEEKKNDDVQIEKTEPGMPVLSTAAERLRPENNGLIEPELSDPKPGSESLRGVEEKIPNPLSFKTTEITISSDSDSSDDEAELLQWRMDRNLLTPEDYKQANGSESSSGSDSSNDEAELLQWRMDRNLLTPEDYKEANGSESANSSVPPLYLEIKGLPEKYNEGIDEDSEDSSEEKTSIFL